MKTIALLPIPESTASVPVSMADNGYGLQKSPSQTKPFVSQGLTYSFTPPHPHIALLWQRGVNSQLHPMLLSVLGLYLSSLELGPMWEILSKGTPCWQWRALLSWRRPPGFFAAGHPRCRSRSGTCRHSPGGGTQHLWQTSLRPLLLPAETGTTTEAPDLLNSRLRGLLLCKAGVFKSPK